MTYSVSIFAEQDVVGPADVVAFWGREGAVDAAEAERRVDEVLVVATTRNRVLRGRRATDAAKRTQGV